MDRASPESDSVLGVAPPWAGAKAPYRDPGLPRPLEAITLSHPAVPPSLEGLRILHLSDLHVRRRRRAAAGTRWARLLEALSTARADLVAYTGDYMDEPGDEPAALDALAQLAEHVERVMAPRLGQWGVFGNHDTPALRAAARHAPRVRWMDAELSPAVRDRRTGHAAPLRVLGLSWPEDPLAALLEGGDDPGQARRPAGEFVLTLAHYPTTLAALSDLRLPLALAGHTHGGQIRLHPRLIPHTSCDLPPTHASGLVRLGGTLCAISRGLGEGVADGLRVNCPPQAPLYTLRRGPLGGAAGPGLVQVQAW